MTKMTIELDATAAHALITAIATETYRLGCLKKAWSNTVTDGLIEGRITALRQVRNDLKRRFTPKPD